VTQTHTKTFVVNVHWQLLTKIFFDTYKTSSNIAINYFEKPGNIREFLSVIVNTQY